MATAQHSAALRPSRLLPDLMLKGKKSIYILLPLNVLIWGYMAYKIYSAFNEEEIGAVAGNNLPAPKLKAEDSNTYVLRLNYADPFLKQEPVWKGSATPKYRAPAAAPPAAAAKKAPAEKPPVEILYSGFIENTSKATRAAMVSVNGVSSIIRPGQVLEGILFESITADAIVVKIGKEKRTIRRGS